MLGRDLVVYPKLIHPLPPQAALDDSPVLDRGACGLARHARHAAACSRPSIHSAATHRLAWLRIIPGRAAAEHRHVDAGHQPRPAADPAARPRRARRAPARAERILSVRVMRTPLDAPMVSIRASAWFARSARQQPRWTRDGLTCLTVHCTPCARTHQDDAGSVRSTVRSCGPARRALCRALPHTHLPSHGSSRASSAPAVLRPQRMQPARAGRLRRHAVGGRPGAHARCPLRWVRARQTLAPCCVARRTRALSRGTSTLRAAAPCCCASRSSLLHQSWRAWCVGGLALPPPHRAVSSCDRRCVMTKRPSRRRRRLCGRKTRARG